MTHDTGRNHGRLILSLATGLTLWSLSLIWYLHCKRNGSVYSVPFLIFSAPAIPGGFAGYWMFQTWGDGQVFGFFYKVCELAVPSLATCLSWSALSYQIFCRLATTDSTQKKRVTGLVWAGVPFVVGWLTIPFIAAKLAG